VAPEHGKICISDYNVTNDALLTMALKQKMMFDAQVELESSGWFSAELPSEGCFLCGWSAKTLIFILAL